MHWLQTAFRSLTHRNYRLYFAGQSTSLVGTWMQQVATAWLVYEQTGSPAWLGWIGFVGQAPALLVSPLAGPLIDASDRRRLVLWTQGLSLCQALVLTLLTFRREITVWHLTGLNLFLGLINALDIPARQALLADLVGTGADLANAVALNSSAFNLARLIGPVLAGLLLAHGGPGVCFLANALSYAAVLFALWQMELPLLARVAPQCSVWQELRAGWEYTWGQASLRGVLLVVGLVSMAGTAHSTLLPILADRLPGGGAPVLGLLTAASGVGALLAAAWLTCHSQPAALETYLLTTPLLFGVGAFFLPWAGTLWGLALLLALMGFALVLQSAAGNILLQVRTEEAMRGRVMSLFTAAVTGAAPWGGLLVGLLAAHLGTSSALCLVGLLCVLAPGLLWLPGCRLAAPAPETAARPSSLQLVRVLLPRRPWARRSRPARPENASRSSVRRTG